MYYLETNGIIALANSLGNKKLQEVSSTSAYSILELISGLNENNFSRKRGPLKKLRESNIPIEWIMPEEKVCNSFPVVSFEEKRISDLKTIFQILSESSSYEELLSEIKKREIHFDLGYFATYDQTWRENFIKATVAGNEKVKRIIDEDKEQLKILQEIDQNIEVNTAITIYSFAIQLSNNLNIDLEEVYNSYNGKSSVFMEAFSSYGITKMLKKQSPANNDIFDLTHLLYISPQKKVMVSNDKIFKSLVDIVSGFELLNNSDFLNKIANE